MKNVRLDSPIFRLPNALPRVGLTSRPSWKSLSATALFALLLLSQSRVDTRIPAEEFHATGTPPSAPMMLPESGNPVQDTPSAQSDPIHAQIMETLSLRRHPWTKPELERLAQAIKEECERHDFEPELILAVILVESGGRPTAVSHVGALGLMQIMPPTGAEVARKLGVPWKGPNTLLDPVVNVKLGVAYLRTLTNRYEDMSTALAAYNWGPGRIDRRLRRGEGLPTEYVNRVIHAYGRKPGPETNRS